MTPEDILSHGPYRLTQTQRESYFDRGCLKVEGVLGEEWLSPLRDAIGRFVETSKGIEKSNAIFDVEPDHSSSNPRLRRVSSPCDQDEIFWSALTESALADVARDLLGPDVKYYQAKLNFKWAKGGAEVKWHQDAPFFPHTNDAVLTMGVYLDDCGPEQGPLMTIPGSHKGEIFDHYASDGRWTGDVQPQDIDRVAVDGAIELAGSAGSITVHNYRTVHGSRPNLSDRPRPLLLYVLSAADAVPYTANALKSRYEQTVFAGSPARWAHHDGGKYLIPPDWSGGYTSIFALQMGESMDG